MKRPLRVQWPIATPPIAWVTGTGAYSNLENAIREAKRVGEQRQKATRVFDVVAKREVWTREA